MNHYQFISIYQFIIVPGSCKVVSHKSIVNSPSVTTHCPDNDNDDDAADD